MASEQKGTILAGLFWMIVISILLFWVPTVGPLIAGIVGGKKSGGVGNAMIAALLPAILLGVFLFFFASVLTGAPLIGMVAGAGAFVLVAANVIPLDLLAAAGTRVLAAGAAEYRAGLDAVALAARDRDVALVASNVIPLIIGAFIGGILN